jgi:very-short-patch-repair endonuclease
MAYRYETGNADVYHLVKPYARHNRKEQTPSEKALWNELRKLPFRFRRQHPIDDYIADFACVEKRLIIEVDGEYHNIPEQKAADAIRTECIEQKGFRVIRYHNDEVDNHIAEVIEEIKGILFNE